MSDLWQYLVADFPQEAIEWRIVKLSEDNSQAMVRPQLYYQAVVDRLDGIGLRAWSNRFIAIADRTIIAEIEIDKTVKSQILSLDNPLLDSTIIAQDAFVQAAEGFGIKTNIEAKDYWVDYDPVTKTIIFEPEIAMKPTMPSKAVENIKQDKSETKEVIDRLVERLGSEGLGLEAAKLLTEHGGYGDNSESAKLLYGKLRSLLLAKTAAKEK